MPTPYDDAFYDSINAGSRASARVVVPLLQALLPISSVVDFGCGQGAWLAVWDELGVGDQLGLDGAYVDPSRLLIPGERFRPADLVHEVLLERRFDVAQSLEVAEHLPASAADTLVDSLTRASDVILFSAAVPGQGGTHHVNERPREWWRSRFERRGYVALDPLRAALIGDARVKPWYRYNLLLYVRHQVLEQHPGLQPHVVDGPIPDLSPLAYKVRKVVLAQLPVWAVDALALARIKLLQTAQSVRR